MFDINRPLKTKVPIDGEMRVVQVRFPNDQEFLTYHNTRRVVDINLGRGKTETDVEKATEAAAALYSKIAIEPSSIPPAAAELVISKLIRCEVVSAEPHGAGFLVVVRALGFEALKHEMRMPSADQVKRFDAITRTVGDGKRVEYKVDLAASGALYDELAASREGYASGIPLVHKHAAVAGAMKAVRDAMEAEGDEDFF